MNEKNSKLYYLVIFGSQKEKKTGKNENRNMKGKGKLKGEPGKEKIILIVW